MATLLDPSDLEVAFRLSAAEHARLLDGGAALGAAPVRAVLDVAGLDLVADGTVTREAAAVGEGQTGRRVFASLSGARGFRPGDFVRVEVEEPAIDGAVRLPASALSAQGDVLALGPEDRLEALPATLLRRQGDDVLVAAGELAGRRIVAERTPALGAGILVRALDPAGAEARPQDATVALEPERRARLVAYLEANDRIPSDVKSRMLTQLEAERVPVAMVERLESRMGG